MIIKSINVVAKDVDAIQRIRERRAHSTDDAFDRHMARMVDPEDKSALCLVAFHRDKPIALLGGYYIQHTLQDYLTFEVSFVIAMEDNNPANGFAVLGLARAAKAESALAGAKTFRFSLYSDQIRLAQMLKKHMGMHVADVTLEVLNDG